MVNRLLSEKEMNEIVKKIKNAIAQGVYEENTTNCHEQKLRKDRINSAMKMCLCDNGFSLSKLTVTSTQECFYYSPEKKCVINVMKSGTFENAIKAKGHYLRDYTKVNDAKEIGQLRFALGREIISKKSIETADKNLGKLYDELGHSDVETHLTIIVDHTKSILNNVEFCILSSDLGRMSTVTRTPEPGYDDFNGYHIGEVNDAIGVPTRNIKLKEVPIRTAELKTVAIKDDKII